MEKKPLPRVEKIESGEGTSTDVMLELVRLPAFQRSAVQSMAVTMTLILAVACVHIWSGRLEGVSKVDKKAKGLRERKIELRRHMHIENTYTRTLLPMMRNQEARQTVRKRSDIVTETDKAGTESDHW
ncbi:hypothetical protein BDP27DRAFT_1367287 [Rhodocollybia butyracea]|uniref:Uncharacterized protein n=1 Tax=Rhodocollybia butyracea TaxID=206335 RepID=A0A9P5PJB5_9AGAR|nr:hypothetical protein BDP27DRAFT_1367287 [Rhodocollybia butyracea]